uniref:Uncharacterized protein n=1 Tax=Anguilla anguilla TaxID=7936 RepID=A0A0E9UYF6_ANGAN
MGNCTKRTRLVLAQTPVVFKDVINLVDKML